MKQKKKESPEEFAARLDELEFKICGEAADPKRMTEIMCKRVHELIRRLPCYRDPDEVPFTNGLYFFYEAGEKSPHDTKGRIVRIGNHPRKRDGLKDRIWMHYSPNKNFSAFRKYVGGALLRKADPNSPCLRPSPGKGHWEKQDEPKCPKCEPIEDDIDRLLKNSFTFRCINIRDKYERDIYEKRIITTISTCSVCEPSNHWLGKKTYSDKVRESGLWNSSFV